MSQQHHRDSQSHTPQQQQQQDVLDPRLGASLPPLPPPQQQAQHAQHHPQQQQPTHYAPAPLQQSHAPASTPYSGGSGQDALRNDPAAVYSAPPVAQPYYYPSPVHHTPNHPASAAAISHPTPDYTTSGPASAQRASYASHDPFAGSAANSPLRDGGGGGDGDPSGGDPLDPNNPDDAKRPRACEACRGLKVRCDQDPALPDIPCKRCAKAGRPCVITQPSRKRQKKADGRVAELEKKLDALTAALQQSQQGGYGSVGQSYGGQPQQQAQQVQQMDGGGVMGTPEVSNKRRRVEDDGDNGEGRAGVQRVAEAEAMHDPALRTTTEDTVEKIFPSNYEDWGPSADLKRFLHPTTPEEFVRRINALVSPESGAKIFDRYTQDMAPHLPAVVFPPGTTAEQVFREQPILYVCILSAASYGMVSTEVSDELIKEVVGTISDCVVRNGAKSLELCQAIQVTALWYRPPERPEQMVFYQLIHMAAVMALELGLGKRSGPPKTWLLKPQQPRLGVDSSTLEARRAWLTCHFLCASASMVFRRPNLIRWTNYMKECLEVLETHPDAPASDKILCQHVRVQHICEDIGLQFLMDDNSAQISITDPKVTYAIEVFENQLKAWKEQIPLSCRTQGLVFFEHVASLYLHEIALHFNHNIEDFRLPLTEESLKSVAPSNDILTQHQAAALEACMQAAHGVLDTVLAMDTPAIKTVPLFLYFVRCAYALVVLIKMHVAVCAPRSELGKLIKPADLRVEHYLDALLTLFTRSATDADFRPHPKPLRIINMLKMWFGRHLAAQGREEAGAQPQPPAREQQQQQDNSSKPSGSTDQTPLHLLSQVATGNQQQQQQGQSSKPTPPNASAASSAPASRANGWTFDRPDAVAWNTGNPYMKPPFDNGNPSLTSASAAAVGTSTSAPYTAAPATDDPFAADPAAAAAANPDFNWGTGFEQAMDIALGEIEGLGGFMGGWEGGWWGGGEGMQQGMEAQGMGQGVQSAGQGNWGDGASGMGW